MSYIGRGLQSGAFRQLDDISSGFDGSDTTHTMQVNSTNVTVGDVNQILLSLGGVIQKPGTDFTVSSSTYISSVRTTRFSIRPQVWWSSLCDNINQFDATLLWFSVRNSKQQ